ncbi:MAG: metallophosphoesterase [Alphaproteobacteria bacterium]|uniref:Metallophosphoesterase n=1 Tax=Candidatus Nitrobium versatile TaxID=2884831 RepID=A0A953JB52_9BACT|nr:metallophosphoesterase [Candidatus Nitrobium versatile]
MKVIIIHLSDIHIQLESNSIFNREEKLRNAVRNLCIDMDVLFLVLTGDVAFSGENDEYNRTIKLLDGIKTELQEYTGKTLNIIMVPGNHDCNHNITSKSIREALIKQIRNTELKIDIDIIEKCCEVQENWFYFNELYQDETKLIYRDKLLRILNYKFESKNIIFNCYNTSWISQKEEVPGIIFPLNLLDMDVFKSKADFVISVFHHPIIWQHIGLYREFMTHIESTSDMVLTGHEHSASSIKKDDLRGNTTEYIEGGVLQDHSNKDKSEFNVIQIDLIKQMQRIIHYRWNKDIYDMSGSSEWRKYERYTSLKKREFELNGKFFEFLEDAGALFKHPRKEKIVLEDFFVYPNLRDLNQEKTKAKDALHGVISAKVLLKAEGGVIRAIFMGAEKTGKTALCRTLYKYYYNNKLIPIFLEGYEIKSSSDEEINKLIWKKFSNQYTKENLEEYKQLSNKERMLIIDDFDKSRLNIANKSLFLDYISGFASNIVMTTNDLFPAEEIFYKEGEGGTTISSFQQFKILDFGYQLRNELINKWNLLGQEHYLDEQELIRKNDAAERVMNTIIGYNYVPSAPIFLLTILQTIEAGQTTNLKESSYGYYYGYLITQTLTNLKITHEDLEAYFSYITELAFELFSNKVREISKDELLRFHKRLCDDYRIIVSFDEIIGGLIKASILSVSNDIVKFRYKYVYYYFVARYLSNNINEEEIKRNISKLCRRLHVEEFANIIMFLTHHSKDPFVLSEILLSAKSIFSEFDIVKFDKDVCFINELLKEVPKLVYKDRDVKQHREKCNRLKDESKLLNDEKNNADDDLYDYESNLTELGLISTLNSAYKTIEIIGQILKNYYGSLKGERKLELGEEAYFLGLRALKSFFDTLNDNIGLAIKDIKAIIEEREITDRDKIEEVSRHLLFQLCEIIAYSFTAKLAQSLGSEKLSETFREIIEKHNFPSVQLINIAIKLDFYKTFPYSELKKLRSVLESNYLPYTILKHLVINYLYMFPMRYDEKQKICSIMEIPMEATRLIDLTSTQRKKA